MFKSTEEINLRRKKSWIYYVILSMTLMGLVFFLCSKIFIHTESPILQTALNKPVQLSTSGSVMVNRWEYSQEKNTMEVQIQLEEVDMEDGNSISFVAQEKVNPNQNLPTKIVYQDDGFYIVQIKKINPEFGAVALDVMRKPEDDSQGIDDADSLKEEVTSEDDNDSEEEERVLEATLYTDQRKVKINNNLGNKTEQEYAMSLINSEKKSVDNLLEKYAQAIKKIDSREEDLEQKIAVLKDDLKYQTSEEKDETNSKISMKEDEINSLKETKITYENEIKAQKDKLEKLNQKERDLESK
ncbi:hypothetical protein ACFRGK_06430 [Bacillus subtilis]|uniref:hypothetical protein n=1 Tax=Bacillus subtilis TaxID=1423 RepID=UPI002795C454|nr:hypothetical protein [Bacillus subtilis]